MHQLIKATLRLSTPSREMLRTLRLNNKVNIIGSRCCNIQKTPGYHKLEKELF